MIDSDLYAESGGTFSSKMFNEFAFHMNTTKIKGGDDGFCNTLLVMIMFFFRNISNADNQNNLNDNNNDTDNSNLKTDFFVYLESLPIPISL